MSGQYKNTYRVESSRLKNWDYRWAGAYFITICTQNKAHYFGDIANDCMQLSPIGILADVILHEIKSHTNNIELGGYVVMPNHVHLVLSINDDVRNKPYTNPLANQKMSSISPKAGSISTVIRSYKSAVTKHTHRLGYEFQWQARFHDHIIRNERGYNRILEYMTNNPATWESDKFYSKPHTA